VTNAASTDFLSILLALSGLVIFGGFAWGVRGHFVSPNLPIGMKLIVALSSLGMVGYLLDLGNAVVPDWRRAGALGLQALAGGRFCGRAQRRDGIGLRWRFPGAIRFGCSMLARFALFAIIFTFLICCFGSAVQSQRLHYSWTP